MRRRHFLAFSLSPLCLSAQHALAQFDTPIPLYILERRTPDGKVQDFVPVEMRFIDFIERTSRLKFQRILVPWNRAQQLALEGKGILFCFTKTPSRELQFDFSSPILEAQLWGVFNSARKIQIKSYEDIIGKCVSLVVGTTSGPTFEQLAREKKIRVEYDTPNMRSRLLKLMQNRCDILMFSSSNYQTSQEVTNFVNTSETFRMDPSVPNSISFSASEQPLFSETVHFASGKGYFTEELKLISDVLKNNRHRDEFKKFLAYY